jgi:NAD(P)-dependent dehydrogenase (short-subunit alcohol dehydrogenase family)
MSESPDPFRLDGRSALITGATQGVGAAIAVACARAGCNLVLHGLREDANARDTIERCRAFGVEVEALYINLVPEPITQPVQGIAQELFDAALRLNPNVDSVVNNAGTYLDNDFVDITDDIFYRTMQLNVASGLFLTRCFARHWLASGTEGRILFTGSINGFLSEPQHVAYDASKGAVASMTRSLCAELAPLGIRVNSMAPGLVVTPMTGILQFDDTLREWMELHTPNRQVPRADVCGPPAVFLLSDAAQHIHGQTLYVDGGMSAWQQPNPA